MKKPIRKVSKTEKKAPRGNNRERTDYNLGGKGEGVGVLWNGENRITSERSFG